MEDMTEQALSGRPNSNPSAAIPAEPRLLSASDEAQWENFVRSHPGANLYHTLAWRDVITEAFGHKPHYLVCSQGGALSGVLPLFQVRAPLVGWSKLISIPYDIGSGGPLALDDSSGEALAKHAMELAESLRVQYLELRCDRRHAALEGLHFKQSEPVLITEMELGELEDVQNRVREDHRHSVRKAKKRGVSMRVAETVNDYLAFYSVYTQVFRDFGTPPYGVRYFRILHEKLHAPGWARLILAEVQGRCVGGLLLFCSGKNVVSKFAACLPEAAPLRAYPALYWEAIRLCVSLGYQKLNWGTATRAQEGLVQFKEGWGAQSRPAILYDLPVRGRIPSIEKYYDSGGLSRRIWKRLPIAVTRVVGHSLNRWFC